MTTMPSGVGFKHLLWALFFLKVYETEENSANAVGKVDEKTYREWSWRFVEAISYLECDVVSVLSIQKCQQHKETSHIFHSYSLAILR